MDDKKAKNRKNIIPSAESFTSPEAAGWLFKLIHEGWLRKRWRKRYCVLSNGVLYFYEFKTSDGTEKTCSSLSLKLFRECIKAPRKECKKSPHTLILEPTKRDESTEQAKNSKLIPREYFYTETPEEQEKWVSKLHEALSLTCIGGSSKLTHITKTRARPPRGGGGNRRPPTKQHIKERAMMSEVTLDAPENLQNGSSKKRAGHIPISALKPPSGGKAKLPLKPQTLTPEPISPSPLDEGEVEVEASDELPLPSPPLALTPGSPKPPPAALKPPSTKRTIVTRTESLGSTNGKSLPPPSPQLLPGMEEADKKNNSLPSSRTSSVSHSSDKASPKSSKGPSLTSEPGTPPLSVTPPVMENSEEEEEEEEKEEQESEERPPNDAEFENLNGNQFHFENLSDKQKSNDRMTKAKSMVDLDRSSEEDEPLPPPPTPPPVEEEVNGMNGDAKKKKKNKKDKKEKKKKGKVKRPSSLVVDA